MSEKVTVCACTMTTVLQARTVTPATHAIQERTCILPPLLSSRCHPSVFSHACRGNVHVFCQRPLLLPPRYSSCLLWRSAGPAPSLGYSSPVRARQRPD